MRDIYKEEPRVEIPVIVYVSPPGAAAVGRRLDRPGGGPAGDGAADEHRLLDADHVGGEDLREDLRRKVVNDAAASSLRALAEEHGRNGDWAEQASS